jgi:acyl carrier protein
MSTTFDRLRAMLIKDYPSTPESVTLTTPLEALGIDSLGLAELLFNVEDEFGIALPTQPVALPTVGDVVAYIDALVVAQNRTASPGEATAATASLRMS